MLKNYLFFLFPFQKVRIKLGFILLIYNLDKKEIRINNLSDLFLEKSSKLKKMNILKY